MTNAVRYPYPAYDYDNTDVIRGLQSEGVTCWYSYASTIVGSIYGLCFELMRGTYRTGIYIEGVLFKSVSNSASWKQVIASIRQSARECLRESRRA